MTVICWWSCSLIGITWKVAVCCVLLDGNRNNTDTWHRYKNITSTPIPFLTLNSVLLFVYCFYTILAISQNDSGLFSYRSTSWCNHNHTELLTAGTKLVQQKLRNKLQLWFDMLILVSVSKWKIPLGKCHKGLLQWMERILWHNWMKWRQMQQWTIALIFYVYV